MTIIFVFAYRDTFHKAAERLFAEYPSDYQRLLVRLIVMKSYLSLQIKNSSDTKIRGVQV